MYEKILTKFKLIQHQESFLGINATKQHIYQDFMGSVSKRILTAAYIVTRMYNEHPRLLYYWSLWSINSKREVSTETQGQEVSWNTEDNAWTRWPVLYHVHCAQLTSAFEGDEWSALCPGYFSPGEKAPGTQWTEDWAGPTASMDVSEIRKTSCCNQKLNYDFLVLSISQATNWSINIDKSTTFNSKLCDSMSGQLCN